METNAMSFGYKSVIDEAMRVMDIVIAMAVRETVENAAKDASVDELVESATANIVFPRDKWGDATEKEVGREIRPQCCKGVGTCTEVVEAVYDALANTFYWTVFKRTDEEVAPWKEYIYHNVWHQVCTMVSPRSISRATIEAMVEAKDEIMEDVYSIGSRAIDNYRED